MTPRILSNWILDRLFKNRISDVRKGLKEDQSNAIKIASIIELNKIAPLQSQ